MTGVADFPKRPMWLWYSFGIGKGGEEMRVELFSAIAVLTLLLGGAAHAQDATVTVGMSLDDGAAVPDNAVIDVQLLDVSRQDVPAETISMQRVQAEAFPVQVRLHYDRGVIDERMTYVISSRIVSDGDVLYRTTSSYPVLTRGATDTVDVVMERMETASPVPDFAGTTWTAFEIGGRALIAETPPELAFMSDGDFGLFAGCNTFRGRATVTTDSIDFPETMAGTLMACPPPQDKLEKDMLEALRNVSGYSYNGDTLALTNAAGVTLLRFRRAS